MCSIKLAAIMDMWLSEMSTASKLRLLMKWQDIWSDRRMRHLQRQLFYLEERLGRFI